MSPKVDRTNREVTLWIGAFVENLITAALAHGFVVTTMSCGRDPQQILCGQYGHLSRNVMSLSSECAHGARFAAGT